MKTSQAGLDAITAREGNELSVYADAAGLLTGGIGHKLIASDGIFHAGDSLTEDEINIWFAHDIGLAEAIVSRYVVISLTQNEFDALVSIVFNAGSAFFKNADGSETHVLQYLNTGSFAAAAAEFLKWVHIHKNGVLVVDDGLVNRRLGEQAQFLA